MSKVQSLISYGEKKQIGAVDMDKNLIPMPEFEVEEIDPENQTLKEFLDSILPPKKVEENGLIFYQFVSNDSAIVNDVIKLSNDLEIQMKVRHAKEKGICRIREELYNECFDEIIRQVAIGCVQRGALLNRIKNEANYSINYYQKLYESLISFSMRKVLMEKKKMKDLQAKKDELESQIETLNAEIEEAERKYAAAVQKDEDDTKEAVEQHSKAIEAQKKEIKDKSDKAKEILTKPKDDIEAGDMETN
ncbi:MAG: dynein arm light chain [archaeon]|nr:dynein arm light chain [archaeon]